jgi:hypothetical protein
LRLLAQSPRFLGKTHF